jgi:hypothetical protein
METILMASLLFISSFYPRHIDLAPSKTSEWGKLGRGFALEGRPDGGVAEDGTEGEGANMLLKGENQIPVSKGYQLEKMANSIKQIIVPDKIGYNGQKCRAKLVLGITAEVSCQTKRLV